MGPQKTQKGPRMGQEMKPFLHSPGDSSRNVPSPWSRQDRREHQGLSLLTPGGRRLIPLNSSPEYRLSSPETSRKLDGTRHWKEHRHQEAASPGRSSGKSACRAGLSCQPSPTGSRTLAPVQHKGHRPLPVT